MKKITSSHVGEVFHKIYDSKIDLVFSFARSYGFFYVVTYEQYELKFTEEEFSCELNVSKIEDIISDLCYRISRDFPKTEFTKWYTQLQ